MVKCVINDIGYKLITSSVNFQEFENFLISLINYRSTTIYFVRTT